MQNSRTDLLMFLLDLCETVQSDFLIQMITQVFIKRKNALKAKTQSRPTTN